MRDPLNHVALEVIEINGKTAAEIEDPGGVDSPLKAAYWHGEVPVVEFAGKVLVNGKDEAASKGYDHVFYYRYIADEPFFFFTKGNRYGIHFAGHEQPVYYDAISHSLCCEASRFNIERSDRLVSFFARRGSEWYSVVASVP